MKCTDFVNYLRLQTGMSVTVVLVGDFILSDVDRDKLKDCLRKYFN